MSECRDAIRFSVYDREPGTAEECKNLDNGVTFFAEVNEIEDIEFNTQLGRDAREQVLIYVSNRVIAADIRIRKQVQIILNGEPQNFLVCRRKDNPANPQVEFGLAKIVAGKDS